MSLMKSLLLAQCVKQVGVRSLASSSAAVDPIQKLFLDKVHEYSAKSKQAGGNLVDSSPQIEKLMADQLLKLQRKFNATGQDMTKFPTFKFSDPTLETVGVEVEVEDTNVSKKQSESEVTKSERLYYDI